MIPPVSDMFPVGAMLLVLPTVTNPEKETAVALLLINAPPPEIPVPFIVNGSAVPSVNPFRSSAAPEADTTVPAPIVPKGVLVPPPAAPSLITPKLMVVVPV